MRIQDSHNPEYGGINDQKAALDRLPIDKARDLINKWRSWKLFSERELNLLEKYLDDKTDKMNPNSQLIVIGISIFALALIKLFKT